MGSYSKREFIIDTDPGVDDAQGIFMALAAPDVKVLALTVTHGNVSVEQTTKNALRLLKVADRLDVPVYKGVSCSLAGTRISASFCHGDDGFGEMPDKDAPGLEEARGEHAVSALVRLVSKNPGEVTLVCLGPLTNVAMALRMDPKFGTKLKQCYIMGGNYQATGNTPLNACAEFNFLADPDAAAIVLNDLGCKITMACWELCLKYSFSWKWYDQFTSIPTAKAKFLKGIGAKSLEIYFKRGTNEELPGYETADSILMSVALDERIVTEKRHVYCTVELHGKYTRGQMVVDWEGCLGEAPNAYVIMSVKHAQYGRMMLNAVQ